MEIDVQKLKSIILLKGLSYTEVATKSEISKQHLSRLIKGRVKECRLSTISAIAKALEVEPTKIIKEE